VDFLKIEKDIPFHRAFSDAYYTAKVFAKIDEDLALSHVSYDTYRAPKDEDHEVWVDFDKYSKYISMGYPTKQELLSNKKVTSTRCYKCGMRTLKKIKWFSPNHKNYYAVSFCPRHGYIKSKLRVRKDCRDDFFAVKTMKKIDKDTYKTLVEKYIKYKENKKKQGKKAKGA
ncbi:MAG: DNA polymerase III, partial [Butyrivibrio sp.]|nr:DNA polymerase III [Butyrivibrio sp.]